MLQLLLHVLAAMVGLEGTPLAPAPDLARVVQASPQSSGPEMPQAGASEELLECPEAPELEVDPDRVLRIGSDLLYPFDPGIKEVDLVIFWPGLGYGTQQMVLEHPQYGVVPALAYAGIDPDQPSDVLVLVAGDPKRPWSKIAKTIARLEQEHGVRVRNRSLGCWSGGVIGAASALSSGEHFSGWMLADPSPAFEARSSLPKDAPTAQVDQIRMWHNKTNWGDATEPGGFYREGISLFKARIAQIGGQTTRLKHTHQELLLLGLTAAIKAAGDPKPLSLYDGSDVVSNLPG